MASERLIDIFDDCATRLANGETIDECVQSYPQYEDDLRVMLEATRIPRRAHAPSHEVGQSQVRVGERFERALRLESIVTRRSYPIGRVASILFVLLFIGSLLTTGVVVVAQDSIPAINSIQLSDYQSRFNLQ